MKLWHLSDTHCQHDRVQIQECDLFIFSGDAINSINIYHNEFEYRNFLSWVKLIPAKFKVIIAGNHDLSIVHNLIDEEAFNNVGAIYLEDEMITIGHYTIYGNPITPKYSNWPFMKTEEQLVEYWKRIPECDILVTHGPPYGILDLVGKDNEIKHVGCKTLPKMIAKRGIKYNLFGHIHNNEDNTNRAIIQVNDVTYSNASCVTDGNFKLTNNGNIINI